MMTVEQHLAIMELYEALKSVGGVRNNFGAVAKRQGWGLQNPDREFDSRSPFQ